MFFKTHSSFLLTVPLLLEWLFLSSATLVSAQPPPAPADILSSNLDRTIDPAKDFFSFANGGWLGRHPIPESEAGWGLGDLVREESLRAKLLSDVHAPPQWRVNVPLSNIPEFHEAFSIKPGSPMWRPPESRVKVW